MGSINVRSPVLWWIFTYLRGGLAVLRIAVLATVQGDFGLLSARRRFHGSRFAPSHSGRLASAFPAAFLGCAVLYSVRPCSSDRSQAQSSELPQLRRSSSERFAEAFGGPRSLTGDRWSEATSC